MRTEGGGCLSRPPLCVVDTVFCRRCRLAILHSCMVQSSTPQWQSTLYAWTWCKQYLFRRDMGGLLDPRDNLLIVKVGKEDKDKGDRWKASWLWSCFPRCCFKTHCDLSRTAPGVDCGGVFLAWCTQSTCLSADVVATSTAPCGAGGWPAHPRPGHRLCGLPAHHLQAGRQPAGKGMAA